MSYLRIPDSNPLSDVWFASIFSQSGAWLFIFSIGSLAEQKCWILMKSNLFCFPLWTALLVPTLRTLPSLRSSRFFSYKFSKSIIVLHFMRKFMTYVVNFFNNTWDLVTLVLWKFPRLSCKPSNGSKIIWKGEIYPKSSCILTEGSLNIPLKYLIHHTVYLFQFLK